MQVAATFFVKDSNFLTIFPLSLHEKNGQHYNS